MLDADAIRHIEEGAAGEEGRMQGRKLIAVGLDGTEQIALDQVAMLAGRLRQRQEDHAQTGKHRVQLDPWFRGAPLAERAANLLQSPCRRGPAPLLERGVAVQVQALEVSPAPVPLPLRIRQAHALLDTEGRE